MKKPCVPSGPGAKELRICFERENVREMERRIYLYADRKNPAVWLTAICLLASSIARVDLIVSEKYKTPVRCLFTNQELLMRTNTVIGTAEDRCSIAGDGKELEIGFKGQYLADALRAVPSEEVCLELTNGLSPIVLTPVDDKHDFAYMVLPVRIKN